MTAKSTLAVVFGGILALSVSALAATQTPSTATAAKHAAAPAKEAPVATKVIHGVVKSVDANQLVVEHKMSGKMSDMSFKLDSATKKEGDVAVGSKVSVRYRSEGADYVATTVTAHAAKGEAKKHPTH